MTPFEFASDDVGVGAGRTAMDEWVALFASRDEMATEYADLLSDHGPEWPTWVTLNIAIIDRWSEAGLRYVKNRAWKIAERRRV